jgi:hypothetical protein
VTRPTECSQHLKERIGLMQTQIASLEAEQQQAQKVLIDIQAQRDRRPIATRR